MHDLPQLTILALVLACTPRTERPPPTKASAATDVEPALAPPAAVPVMPADKQPTIHECTRTSYLVEQAWEGEGSSSESAQAAQLDAEMAACVAAGATSNCVDGVTYLAAVKASNATMTARAGQEPIREYNKTVRLLRVGRSAQATGQSDLSEMAACQRAKANACLALGFDRCDHKKVFTPTPPGEHDAFGFNRPLVVPTTPTR